MKGADAEDRALAELRRLGHTLLARNYRSPRRRDRSDHRGRRRGWSSARCGSGAAQSSAAALESVTPRKLALMQRAALAYLTREHGHDDLPCRMQVVSIEGAARTGRLSISAHRIEQEGPQKSAHWGAPGLMNAWLRAAQPCLLAGTLRASSTSFFSLRPPCSLLRGASASRSLDDLKDGLCPSAMSSTPLENRGHTDRAGWYGPCSCRLCLAWAKYAATFWRGGLANRSRLVQKLKFGKFSPLEITAWAG